MQLALPGNPHLTYCTNIHAGETWSDIEAALADALPRVKAGVSPDRAMGVGLRLSAQAADELATPSLRDRFKRFLRVHDLYVFTVNAFPYGNFHGARVKERVYEPDWRAPERLGFTCRVADLLADLAPDGIDASISTVPGGFRANIASHDDIARVAEGYARAAAHLHGIGLRTGKTVTLAIEPEPACFLETTDEAVRFLEEHMFRGPAAELFARLAGVPYCDAEAHLRRHVGLCFDVCHSAVAFEETIPMLDAVHAAGIAVAKLQLSSALRATGDAARFERLLGRFDEGIYLHQTVERNVGAITRHLDLSDAFGAARSGAAGGEWRVHCHVPVFVDRFDELQATQQNLRDALSLCRKRAVSPHLEVETYTWSVLPDEVRSPELVGDIVRELAWVRTELGA